MLHTIALRAYLCFLLFPSLPFIVLARKPARGPATFCPVFLQKSTKLREHKKSQGQSLAR